MGKALDLSEVQLLYLGERPSPLQETGNLGKMQRAPGPGAFTDDDDMVSTSLMCGLFILDAWVSKAEFQG